MYNYIISKKKGVILKKEDRMIKSLKAIDAIVKAYYNGTIKITTQQNGFLKEEVGLDVVMAMINNNIIDALYEPTERKEGFIYV